jgi:hypothetical protein
MFDPSGFPNWPRKTRASNERITMGRKRAEPIIETPPAVVEEETTTEKKSRKLDVEALRTLADECPSKNAGQLLIDSLDSYVEARKAYQDASKQLRFAASLAGLAK